MSASPDTDPNSVTSRHVAKGVGTTLLSRLGGVVEIVSQPLYVFLFGLASYGMYTALWAAVNLAENILDLGMTSAMQRTVPKANDKHEATSALRISLLLGVLPGAVVALIVSLMAPQIAPIFNVAAADQDKLVPAIRLFAWALPLWAFVEVATSALRSMRLFGPEIRLRLFWEQLIRVVFAVVFWALGWGITGLLVAHMLSLTAINILSLQLLRRHFHLRSLLKGRLFDDVAVDTIKAGFAALPTNLVQQIFTDGPPLALNILIPGAAGATASGLYGIARKIASVIQLFRTAFAYVLAPLASAATRGAPGDVQAIYAFATRLLTATVLPLTFVLLSAAAGILHVFGHGAEAALPALMILFVARMFETMSGGAKPVQQAVGGYWRQLTSSIAGLSVAVALGVVLTPLYGLTGMAASVGSGIVTAAVVPLFQLMVHERLSPFHAPFGSLLVRALGISLAAGALGLLVARIPHPAELVVFVPLLLGSVWCSCRYALPHDDRLSLGKKTAKKLRLI